MARQSQIGQSLSGKTAVITGAGSGIGRGLATVLAERGCRLALSDINADGLAEAAANLSGDVVTEVLDVADRAAVFAHAERVTERFGAADLVINGGSHRENGQDHSRRSGGTDHQGY